MYNQLTNTTTEKDDCSDFLTSEVTVVPSIDVDSNASMGLISRGRAENGDFISIKELLKHKIRFLEPNQMESLGWMPFHFGKEKSDFILATLCWLWMDWQCLMICALRKWVHSHVEV